MKRHSILCAAALLVVAFPPTLRHGKWVSTVDGTSAGPKLAKSLSRGLFGYIPKWRPLWSVNQWKASEHAVRYHIDQRGFSLKGICRRPMLSIWIFELFGLLLIWRKPWNDPPWVGEEVPSQSPSSSSA